MMHIYNNNVITCIFWCKILGRADALNCAALRLSCIVIITFPCIVIIASLHHISCVIVIIHLTLSNSQGEVCDEEEAIYYTFGPGKAQKVTDVIKKKKSWDIIRKCFITKINVSKSAFLKFYLYFCRVIQNFVLFLQHDNKQNVWIWQASRCTNRVA